mgnify:CR=1 FL=1
MGGWAGGRAMCDPAPTGPGNAWQPCTRGPWDKDPRSRKQLRHPRYRPTCVRGLAQRRHQLHITLHSAAQQAQRCQYGGLLGGACRAGGEDAGGQVDMRDHGWGLLPDAATGRQVKEVRHG